MTSGNVNPQGSQASSMDDFGDFSQGPSFPSQGGGSNAEFSDFQGAAQPVAQGRGLLLINLIYNLFAFFFLILTFSIAFTIMWCINFTSNLS